MYLRLLCTTLFAISSSVFCKHYTEIATMKQYDTVCNCGKPVIIKYYAPWCQACTHMEPGYDKAAAKYKGAQFYTVNVDKAEFKPLIKKHKIEGLPTTIFHKNNKEVRRERGSMGAEEVDRISDIFLNGSKAQSLKRTPSAPAAQPKKTAKS